MKKTKRCKLSNGHLWAGLCLLVLACPVLVGWLVSVNVWSDLVTGNDWIGFWGGYAGAILSGAITLIVMHRTFVNGQEAQIRAEKRQLCNQITTLLSSFCIEIKAYRSKMKDLSKKAGGGKIKYADKLAYGAFTENAEKILLEVKMLLCGIDGSEVITKCMSQMIKSSNLNSKSMGDTNKERDNLINIATEFFTAYLNDK